ncbi:enoyl-CoA hydratase/isomerase family protein [Mesorhizobium sp.]|uniref:enoyl-CoA hydratase/isomerase family protein n=1 Tax=Mesorhizobium sp. TaxID=1871066 RepID=UPI000FE7A9F6|nr:enoyl-CoA hydratase/isomerase family protein [Mesorhizobium sp.]RWP99097.1 MAG: enoyl-CoA hydratase/isomerase family protein [Mesorhizobium sp.]RWQ27604.1 MAG: enoyl-CoA hydratase/isomerase family protein [Mesorhizobium sp.]
MLDCSIENRVAILTINRPNRRNALCTELVHALKGRFATLHRNDVVGAIVLTGAAPSFCAGSDLKELGTMDVPGMVAHEAHTASMARLIGLLDVPVIAAVEGHALGGGFILATSCDLVVTAEGANWSLPEVPNGWVPPWGLKSLTGRVSAATARRIVWGFESFSGQAAVDLGIADYVSTTGQALAMATQIAERLAALPRAAVRSTKRFFQADMLGQAEVWDFQAGHAFAENCTHPPAIETLKRFAIRT